MPIHIQSENKPIQSNHGYITSGFSSDNYSLVDQKNHLKFHVFEDNAGSIFCYVFGMLITYDFDTIIILDSPKVL